MAAATFSTAVLALSCSLSFEVLSVISLLIAASLAVLPSKSVVAVFSAVSEVAEVFSTPLVVSVVPPDFDLVKNFEHYLRLGQLHSDYL
ncbi:hypothetical protein AAFS18_06135 [Lactobacillus crispatus]